MAEHILKLPNPLLISSSLSIITVIQINNKLEKNEKINLLHHGFDVRSSDFKSSNGLSCHV